MSNKSSNTPRGRGRPARDGSGDFSSREEILEAALVEFGQHGYHGTSMSAIARKARVTQPLISYHFQSKADLWKDTVNYGYKNFHEIFANVRQEMRDFPAIDMLKLLLRRLILFSAEKPYAGRIALHEMMEDSDRLVWLVENQLKPLMQLLQELLQEAKEEGSLLEVDMATLPQILVGAAVYYMDTAAATRLIQQADPLEPERVQAHADTVITILFRGLNPHGTAAEQR